VISKTLNRCPVRTHATNATAASITDPVPTLTEPTGDGVVTLADLGASPNFGSLHFTAVGSDNSTATAKVYLWSKVDGPVPLWVPVPVLNLDLTFSSVTGVATTPVPATERFADTIALTSGTVNESNIDITSPANNTIARVALDVLGASKVEVRFAKGTTTSVNALFRGF
jgi:hypothetical protein